ncbi:hypothetical protein SEA_CRICKO_65 [Streptomyces phage CricKo]|nr:hypothetical protein SEA_RAINYDAI_63 [Streptomyces phage Rainydai]QJD49948.1 hypothetical protein SEA_CRICKO_65 [Streptomyces phage CricKo]QNL30680.1 hypothetical protein SEA_THIQQUMS_65 [Streptomyces phage Thiqqums]
MIHNHGPEEGPGLACNEITFTDGSVGGVCLMAQSVEFCDLSDETPPDKENPKGLVWCLDHDLPADHCGPDGDTPVCKTFADSEGCNCCPENYNRGELNAMMHRMAWFIISDREKEIIRRLAEREMKHRE